MTFSEVFHISGAAPGLTGRLEGTGQLPAGDIRACDGGRWPIASIEQFRAVLTTAEPGMEIGVLLSGGPPADALRGRTAQFEQDTSAGPQFTVLPPKKRWRR